MLQMKQMLIKIFQNQHFDTWQTRLVENMSLIMLIKNVIHKSSCFSSLHKIFSSNKYSGDCDAPHDENQDAKVLI